MPKGDGLYDGHPLYEKMKEIIWSAEGQKAAEDAVKAGLPAICGVDPLLQKHLPNEYRYESPANSGQQLPAAAGTQVAEVMSALGYTKHRTGVRCPPKLGCVAKTGGTWKLKG